MNECRHPQILLLPVQQFQRNVGYLMGQGVSKAELLQMWGLRAGLLIEPLRNLHGEVLALRSANRPLQVRRLLSQSQVTVTVTIIVTVTVTVKASLGPALLCVFHALLARSKLLQNAWLHW